MERRRTQPLGTSTVLLCLLLASCVAEQGSLAPPSDSPSPPVDLMPDAGVAVDAGVGSPGTDVVIAAPCVDDMGYFGTEVWGPVLSGSCIGCHNAQGAARESKLVLQGSGLTGFMAHNFEVLREVAGFQFDGEPLLLLKPTGQIAHGGGEVLTKDSEGYAALVGLLERFESPVVCDGPDPALEAWDLVEILDARATWRKATLALAGRLPTTAEDAELQIVGEPALESLLHGLVREEGFYRWLKRAWNDLLLTDRYLAGNQALDLLSNTDYPDRFWFQDETYAASDVEKVLGNEYANVAVAREALEIIAWVVREGRPFSDVLTLDHTLVNPFSAHSLGVSDIVDFSNAFAPSEFVPASTPGYPHSGVLSTSVFLNRFPTTDTNRNRHRTRIVFDLFLATDVLKLADRPIDPTSIEAHNPTMFNPNCVVCHGTIDPVAGGFQNWDESGRYLPPEEGWHGDMVPAGFGDEVMPYEERETALPWLAQRLAADPRFDVAAVRNMWRALTGDEPIQAPDAAAGDDYQTRYEGYKAQHALFEEIRVRFAEGGRNLQNLVVDLVLSPAYRAVNLYEDPDAEAVVRYADVGPARLLTPEMLHDRLFEITGVPWKQAAQATGVDMLLNTNRYLLFYGGMDSDDVTRRITQPNGLMAAVQQRMASEMACYSAGYDFSLPPAERRLFPYVEVGYTPEDANGFEVPTAIEAIRANIQHLHAWILGERLALDDPEIDHTYDLFLETWREGMEGIASGEIGTSLIWSCQARVDWATMEPRVSADYFKIDTLYTVRAWRAVLNYLFSDFHFLYE